MSEIAAQTMTAAVELGGRTYHPVRSNGTVTFRTRSGTDYMLAPVLPSTNLFFLTTYRTNARSRYGYEIRVVVDFVANTVTEV